MTCIVSFAFQYNIFIYMCVYVYVKMCVLFFLKRQIKPIVLRTCIVISVYPLVTPSIKKATEYPNN